MDILPFAPDHLGEAARLLALRHAADRTREPVLPERFEDPEECLPRVEQLVVQGHGVAAVRDGRLAGYLLTQDGAPREPYRRAFVPIEGHAIAPGEDVETYRLMYGALAPVLLKAGLFVHQVLLPSRDEVANEAWFSLNFGQRIQVAGRDLDDVGGGPAGFEIRLAGPADAGGIWQLLKGLGHYNTTPPLFAPYLHDEEGLQSEMEKDLAGGGSAFWMAYEGDEPVGVMQIGPSREMVLDRPPGTANLDIAFVRRGAREVGLGSALLRRCVIWARENGYQRIALDFFTSNIAGARFWLGHGFRPMATILERRIDAQDRLGGRDQSVSLEIVPFSPEHLAGAAELLARAQRRNRVREPRLPQRYEDLTFARDLIERTAADANGVAALRDGRLTGYLIATFETDVRERVAVVLTSGTAIMPGEDAEMYRLMYAGASPAWVANGYFTHFVQVAGCDPEAVRAWFSLGFGRYSVYNWRDLSPVAGPESAFVVRRVGPEAFDDWLKLNDGLRRYNATSPILHPYIRPSAAQAAKDLDAERALMASDGHAYFIAYAGTGPAGLMILRPPERDDVLTPDGSTYLHIAFVNDSARSGGVGAAMVNRGLAWAREQGYELCTVGYFAPNLLGARFWQSKGFLPLGYSLERRIDDRIAWASHPDA